MKRLVRFASIAAAVAAVLAAVKAMRRPGDPLPTPASTPSEPWPPLRGDNAPAGSDSPWTPDASPAPNTPETPAPAPVASPKPASTDDATVRSPEPDGVPVAAAETEAAPITSGSSHGTEGSSWTAPTADGGCPDGFPVKAKLGSKIFHSPGQLNYPRTTPDRCYVDAAAAEADGLRAAKR